MKLRMVRFPGARFVRPLVASLLLSLTGCENASETDRQVRTSDSPDVACDRLAADPADSQRKGPGVAVNDLELEQAIEVCVTAVEAQPDNIRLRFQLGRVLVAADHTNEALPFLQEAADKNYPAALAYIGDLQDTDEAAKQY